MDIFHLSLIPSNLKFAFESAGSKDFSIKIISLLSKMPGCEAIQRIEPAKIFTSNTSKKSS